MERLELAVRLASSVLQFHTSGWLRERWGKKDIYLVQPDPSKPSLGTPIVHHNFTSEPSPKKLTIVCSDLSLFSLGIVLIELWFWKCVESFKDDECQEGNLDTAKFMKASEQIAKLYEEAGVKYADSVRRCIHGLDHKESRLENNEFKSEVYLKVLRPLEKHLEDFCGKSLEDILQKQGGHQALSLSPPP